MNGFRARKLLYGQFRVTQTVRPHLKSNAIGYEVMTSKYVSTANIMLWLFDLFIFLRIISMIMVKILL